MTDLSSLYTAENAERGVEMLLKHPVTRDVLEADTGEEFSMTIAGTDSRRWRNYLRKAIKSSTKKGGADDDSSCEALAELILGWKNIQLNGVFLEYSKEAVIKLLKDYPWIKEQVDAFASDRANFLPKD